MKVLFTKKEKKIKNNKNYNNFKTLSLQLFNFYGFIGSQYNKTNNDYIYGIDKNKNYIILNTFETINQIQRCFYFLKLILKEKKNKKILIFGNYIVYKFFSKKILKNKNFIFVNIRKVDKILNHNKIKKKIKLIILFNIKNRSIIKKINNLNLPVIYLIDNSVNMFSVNYTIVSSIKSVNSIRFIAFLFKTFIKNLQLSLTYEKNFTKK